MKKTMLTITAVMLASILVIGSVLAVQYGNRNNAASVDNALAYSAVESGDYASWKALHKDSSGKMASLINEGNFHLLKEMHDAREAGDYARIQEIKTELGFENGAGKGKGNGSQKGKNSGYANCQYAN